MDRSQVLDSARDVISGWPIGSGYYSTKVGSDEAGEIAQAVLDEILPQVATVEELEALPEGAMITNGAHLLQSLRVREYEPNTWFEFTDRRWSGSGRLGSLGLVEHGPWTVVWRP